MQLKTIDFQKENSITGVSGKVYTMTDSLNVIRYKEYIKFQNKLGYGITFEQTLETLNTAIALANKGKGVEGWTMIYNYTQKVKDFTERADDVFLFCTLFLVSDDEDLSVWDLAKAKIKIDDWKEYDVNSFFQLAANSVSGLIENYLSVSQSISKKLKGK